MGGAYSDDELANMRDEMNEDASDEEDLEEPWEEDEEPEDPEPDWDDQEDIYGPDGEVVYSPWYEAQKIDRKCQGCCRIFKGMPDHGYCDTCADIIERGGEYPVCEEDEGPDDPPDEQDDPPDEETTEEWLESRYGEADL